MFTIELGLIPLYVCALFLTIAMTIMFGLNFTTMLMPTVIPVF